ncbi:DUF938 domain-containing protein [Roseospira goensis]|uniref:DUF938 domain-containing protein n=1 Tax=Roseospira goensis TaxID=391922 RepID=A0A7W6RX75_9PROT|nr:hypothetical protein [Roseospira goensis]
MHQTDDPAAAAPVVAPGGPGDRLHAPATARNRDAIRAVLTRVLPAEGTLLEVACGSGEHAAHLAPALPGWRWRPTEADPVSARGAATLLADTGPDTVEPVRLFDVRTRPWPDPITRGVTAILAINLIHIAPWAVAEALLAGAGHTLPPGGLLYLYGAFMVDGRHTAPSNDAFDRSLRAQESSWGVRDLTDVVAAARRHGLTLSETVSMPANNLSVVFTRTDGSA